MVVRPSVQASFGFVRKLGDFAALCLGMVHGVGWCVAASVCAVLGCSSGIDVDPPSEIDTTNPESGDPSLIVDSGEPEMSASQDNEAPTADAAVDVMSPEVPSNDALSETQPDGGSDSPIPSTSKPPQSDVPEAGESPPLPLEPPPDVPDQVLGPEEDTKPVDVMSDAAVPVVPVAMPTGVTANDAGEDPPVPPLELPEECEAAPIALPQQEIVVARAELEATLVEARLDFEVARGAYSYRDLGASPTRPADKPPWVELLLELNSAYQAELWLGPVDNPPAVATFSVMLTLAEDGCPLFELPVAISVQDAPSE